MLGLDDLLAFLADIFIFTPVPESKRGAKILGITLFTIVALVAILAALNAFGYL